MKWVTISSRSLALIVFQPSVQYFPWRKWLMKPSSLELKIMFSTKVWNFNFSGQIPGVSSFNQSTGDDFRLCSRYFSTFFVPQFLWRSKLPCAGMNREKHFLFPSYMWLRDSCIKCCILNTCFSHPPLYDPRWYTFFQLNLTRNNMLEGK